MIMLPKEITPRTKFQQLLGCYCEGRIDESFVGPLRTIIDCLSEIDLYDGIMFTCIDFLVCTLLYKDKLHDMTVHKFSKENARKIAYFWFYFFPLDDEMCHASENGHTAVVDLLLKDGRVDPAADDNYAIRWASYYRHTEVVKLLLKDKRVSSFK